MLIEAEGGVPACKTSIGDACSLANRDRAVVEVKHHADALTDLANIFKTVRSNLAASKIMVNFNFPR